MTHHEASPGPLATALRHWASKRERHKPHPGGEESRCDPTPPGPCVRLRQADGPEHVVHFRQALPLEPLEVDLGDPVEPGSAPLEFGCIAVAEMTADFALDLRYEQWWYYRSTLIGALSASVALAPGETLSLSMRNTQRKQFDRETVDEVERSESTESTVADKDVLNVTRSSSRTNSWTINGNASITLPKFSAGVSGSVSESVTEAASSSAQRTRDSTEKSATNLKTVQKVQIRETSEVTTEAATSRRITNPYRDRSMRLDAYELAKLYCVEFHLREVAPVIVLTFDRIDFSRDFVLRNAGFLADELTDRPLEFELSEALQVTSGLQLEGVEARTEAIALVALDLLFGQNTIFNFPPFPPLPPIRPPNWDENDPAGSFEEPLESWSGFSDAMENNVAVVFSILAFYNRLYHDHVLPVGGRVAVEVAMSLDRALAPRWTDVEETDAITNVIDASQATEVFRRLGGFLTMTSGMLRPLLEPAEEERETRRRAERAEFVINRVVEHLNCHARYYTEAYLGYIGGATRMQAVYRLAAEVLEGRLIDADQDALAHFDPEAAFLDANRIVMPLRVPLTPEELDALLHALDPDAGAIEVELGLLDTQRLTIPTDGVHIEASAGACVLGGIPDEPISGPLHVVLDQQ